jgi:tetratricopeptide (TPR) repeat protein
MKAQPAPTPAPFVSRNAELEWLDGLLVRSLAGAGQIGFVAGDAGLGKSALVREFMHRAQRDHPDLLVAFSDCNPHSGAGDAFLPFREVLGLLTGDVDAPLAEGAITVENAARLRRFLRFSAEALTEVGPDLVGIFVPGASLVAWLGGKVAQNRLGAPAAPRGTPRGTGIDRDTVFQQFTNVLRTIATKQPLVIVLDDLQWADAASLELLFHLARRIEGSRLLIIGTYRPGDIAAPRAGEPHPLQPVLNETKRYYGEIVCDLGAGTEPERRELFDALLDAEQNELHAAFRDELFSRTNGHPLFTLEMLSALRDQGVLVRGEGGWSARAGIDWSRLPARIEGVISERVRRLRPELVDLLSAASVLGDEFSAEVLASMLDLPVPAVVRQLSTELDRQHGIVRAQGVITERGRRLSLYRFRHALFQSYLYHGLDDVQAPLLHESAAAALEQFVDASRAALDLARHCEFAQLWASAARYRTDAAEVALQRFAPREAEALARRAGELAALAADTAISARAARVLGDVHIAAGSPEDARHEYERALALDPAPLERARLLRGVGRTHELQMQMPQARTALQRARSELEQLADHSSREWRWEWVQLHIELVWSCYFTGAIDEMRVLHAAVADLATAEQQARMLQVDVLYRLRKERYCLSEATIAAARAFGDASRATGNRREAAVGEFQVGFALLWAGRPTEALASLHDCLAFALPAEDAPLGYLALTYTATAHRLLGNIDETVASATRGAALATAAGAGLYAGACSAHLAWAAYRRGDFPAAADTAASALAQMAVPHYPFKWFAALPAIAAHVALQQYEQAAAYVLPLALESEQCMPAPLGDAVRNALEHGCSRDSLAAVTARAQECNRL